MKRLLSFAVLLASTFMWLHGQDFMVALSVNPASGGEVTGAGTYPSGASVTVTASSATGYQFVNWTNNSVIESLTESYTFSIMEDITLVANFTLNQYNINVSANPAEAGTVSGTGVYSHGTTVTLSATPNAGYVFLNWTDGGTVVSTEATWSFEATSELTLAANFERIYTVILNSYPAEGGTTDGAGSYDSGANATVTATPAAGYSFTNWKTGGSSVSTDNPYTFQVNADISLEANFSLSSYTISTSSSPAAGGTTNGAGIYNHGTQATVTATPSAGYLFVNWTESGSIVSTNVSYSFTVIGARTLVANYSLITYTVTTASSPSAGGTTSGGGNFSPSATATVTATPATGYQFVDWTEGGTTVSTNSTYSFLVSSNRNLVATFQSISYLTVNTLSNPSSGGTTNGSGTYSAGTIVTVRATEATGYNFINWSEGGSTVSSSESYTFSLNSNRTLTANFSQNQYTISTSSSPATGGTTSGGGSFTHGDDATVTAAASSGYTFVNWTQEGTVVSTDISYSFTVTSGMTLVANFSQITYTISLSSIPASGGSTNGGGTYGSGTTATVTAAPATGYRFVNWTQGGSAVSANPDYSFPVTANVTLAANFAVADYTITTNVSPAGTGTATGGGSFNHGTSVTVRATPASGYQFTNWTEDGSAVSTSANYTFTVTGNRNLLANFSQIPILLALTGPEGNNLRNNDIITIDSQDAGSFVITVNANADWSVTENSLWFKAVKEGDSRIRINYLENISVIDKEGPLEVSTTLNAEMQVIVRQEARVSQLSLSKFGDVILYPNPAGDKTGLFFPRELQGKIRVSIASVQGIPVKTSEYADIQENQIVEFDLTGIRPGQYLIIIADETDQKTIRMIKF